jgi:hypothetical protein
MSQPTSERRKWWLTRLPGVGSFLEIASDYASEGSADFFEKVAPIKYWLRTLGWPFVVAALLALIPYPCGCMPYSFTIDAKPYDVALALIPSLLGFGIGAYALVFGLSGDLLKKIQAANNAKQALTNKPTASVLSINSAFAFPLALMTLTTVTASVQKMLPEIQLLATFTWFLTFLCLLLTYQLVVALYRLGRVIILDRV